MLHYQLSDLRGQKHGSFSCMNSWFTIGVEVSVISANNWISWKNLGAVVIYGISYAFSLHAQCLQTPSGRRFFFSVHIPWFPCFKVCNNNVLKPFLFNKTHCLWTRFSARFYIIRNSPSNFTNLGFLPLHASFELAISSTILSYSVAQRFMSISFFHIASTGFLGVIIQNSKWCGQALHPFFFFYFLSLQEAYSPVTEADTASSLNIAFIDWFSDWSIDL